MELNFVDQLPEESHNSVIGRDFGDAIYGADAQLFWRRMMEFGPVLQAPNNPLHVATVTAEASNQVLRDPAVFSSGPEALYFGSDTGAIPLQVDPPDHSRYRKLLDPLFTPKLMNAREPQIAAIVNRLIDSFIDRGECDFSTEFATPFPSEMFLTLMGLPMSELKAFLKAKEDMIRPGGNNEEERIAIMAQASGWIVNIINESLAQREKEQSDDILSYFLKLEKDGVLTREEILNICILFIPAGLDTVTDSLETSFAYLAQHPEQRKMIVDNPDLLHLAVEELLRYETPVPSVARITTQDTEISGCPVSKGTRIRVSLAAINHSDTLVPNPDVVQLDREINPHVAFGAGIHRCVGSYLARIELRVAMREWHKRIPEYHLKPGHEIKYRVGLREIDHLPLVFR